MGLLWNKGSRSPDVNELIVGEDYARAIEVITADLERHAKNERLRLQLAHVLALAGKKDEAAGRLEGLADDLAQDGFATKAVAVLKKIQKLDPTRAGIDERLASMIGGAPPAAASPESWADTGPRPELSLEIGEPTPVEVTAEGELAPPPERLGELATRPATQATGAGAMGTPLFRGMSRDEIVALIRGLRLLTLASGHIVVSEGEPGDSLFVITTGRCRAFVRNPAGRNIEVRELLEGDFFGEISVLTGHPRSATITTATLCELLELDRSSLDAIIETHPRVKEVLEEFHEQRADCTVEAAIRAMGS